MHGRGLYIQAENESTIDILMVTPEGKEKKISEIVPAHDLLNAVEMDYSAYRKRIAQLQNLPLFQEKLDIAMAEYEELVNTAKKIPNLLEKIDPVGAFVVRSRIALELQIPDDGTASFWLYSGQRILEALMEPVLTQLRLRNIFEVTLPNRWRTSRRRNQNNEAEPSGVTQAALRLWWLTLLRNMSGFAFTKNYLALPKIKGNG